MTPNAELWCRRMDYAEGLPSVKWWEQQAPKGRYMLEVHRRYVDWLKEAEDERR